MNQGCQGTVPSYKAQLTVREDSEAFDDTHCVPCAAVKLLNYFPTKGGVSDTFSPKTILTLRSTYVSRLDSTVRCTRKIPRATVNIPEQKEQSVWDRAEICRADSNLWL
jgi:hypothetical protein